MTRPNSSAGLAFCSQGLRHCGIWKSGREQAGSMGRVLSALSCKTTGVYSGQGHFGGGKVKRTSRESPFRPSRALRDDDMVLCYADTTPRRSK